MTTENTGTKIVKTILEPVESPAIDTLDMLPADSEALELAEQELAATKEALDAEEAESDRLHVKVRTMEAALLDLWTNRDDLHAVKAETFDFIRALQVEVAARPDRPSFKK
jgi:hypothetical protein